jgi:hypothetical protein
VDQPWIFNGFFLIATINIKENTNTNLCDSINSDNGKNNSENFERRRKMTCIRRSITKRIKWIQFNLFRSRYGIEMSESVNNFYNKSYFCCPLSVGGKVFLLNSVLNVI